MRAYYYGNKQCVEIEMQGITVFFSYGSAVAFKINGAIYVPPEGEEPYMCSITTGKHLAEFRSRNRRCGCVEVDLDTWSRVLSGVGTPLDWEDTKPVTCSLCGEEVHGLGLTHHQQSLACATTKYAKQDWDSFENKGTGKCFQRLIEDLDVDVDVDVHEEAGEYFAPKWIVQIAEMKLPLRQRKKAVVKALKDPAMHEMLTAVIDMPAVLAVACG